MRRFTLALLMAATVLLAARTADADWHDFWGRVKLGWYRNNAWPEPFQTYDRQSVRAAFVPMIAGGWQSQTTLTDADFDSNTHELTRAGRYKVRWIVTQAPPARRKVYVLVAEDENATATRIDQVQQSLAQIIPRGPLPPVLSTYSAPRGVSGGYSDGTWKAFEDQLPPPTLQNSGSLSTSTGNQ